MQLVVVQFPTTNYNVFLWITLGARTRVTAVAKPHIVRELALLGVAPRDHERRSGAGKLHAVFPAVERKLLARLVGAHRLSTSWKQLPDSSICS